MKKESEREKEREGERGKEGGGKYHTQRVMIRKQMKIMEIMENSSHCIYE